MVKLLIDTCVWIDIAKEPKQMQTLQFLEELIRNNDVSLLVPQLVLDEFARNKARIVNECRQSLSSTLKKAKDVVTKYGSKRKTKRALDQLNDLDNKLSLIGEAVGENAGYIEGLLKNAEALACSNEIMLRAAKRAVQRIAPCHSTRNSINDAIILETYAEAIRTKGERFGFVTHNKNDFGSKDDQRRPHPDIAPLFSKIKSRYFIGLLDALLKIRPDMRRDMMIEEIHWTNSMRTLDEIGSAEFEFFEKVWYNRHKFHEWQIKTGKVKLVDTYTPGKNQVETAKGVWEKAKQSARKVEEKYGIKNVGPWDDFEWGMLNGKLSALRWVMGDEWDMLDT